MRSRTRAARRAAPRAPSPSQGKPPPLFCVVGLPRARNASKKDKPVNHNSHDITTAHHHYKCDKQERRALPRDGLCARDCQRAAARGAVEIDAIGRRAPPLPRWGRSGVEWSRQRRRRRRRHQGAVDGGEEEDGGREGDDTPLSRVPLALSISPRSWCNSLCCTARPLALDADAAAPRAFTAARAP